MDTAGTVGAAVQTSQATEFMNALLEISREIAANDARAYPAILAIVKKTLKADAVLIIGIYGDAHAVVIGAPALAEYIGKQTVLAVPDGTAAKEPLPDKVRAVYSYDLAVRDSVYGRVGFAFEAPHPLTEPEQTFIQTVVNQLTSTARGKHLQGTLNEFINTISHDLRSPLTYALGFASMLTEAGELNAVQKNWLERITGGMNQMVEMLEKVLDAGRLDPETGYYSLGREVVDVVTLVRDLVHTHTPTAQGKKITLTADIDPDIPVLSLDKMMVNRAFNNLIDNAIKYSPDGGTVTVSLHMKDKAIMFAVKDTGFGMNEEQQKKLFQKFNRLRRKGQERIKGTGLGLFVVKHVAQKHGGDAWVESREGVGSTFFIRIPLEGANLPGASD